MSWIVAWAFHVTAFTSIQPIAFKVIQVEGEVSSVARLLNSKYNESLQPYITCVAFEQVPSSIFANGLKFANKFTVHPLTKGRQEPSSTSAIAL